MNKKIVAFNLAQRNKKVPELHTGDVVKVYRKFVDGKKETVQMFSGMVIAIKGKQSSSQTITVRKVSHGVGVELVLPIHSANIEKIEVTKRAKTRRAKLYYVRSKSTKSLKMKYQDTVSPAKDDVKAESEKVETE